MAEKPKALQLADELGGVSDALADRAADELRRLVAENERLKAELAAEREKLAHWMRSMSYATGHGDTIEDLLDHLGTQISEGLEVEVLMEREACAKVCETTDEPLDPSAAGGVFAAAIRARSKK